MPEVPSSGASHVPSSDATCTASGAVTSAGITGQHRSSGTSSSRSRGVAARQRAATQPVTSIGTTSHPLGSLRQASALATRQTATRITRRPRPAASAPPQAVSTKRSAITAGAAVWLAETCQGCTASSAAAYNATERGAIRPAIRPNKGIVRMPANANGSRSQPSP
jgi:hypothetical protein